MDLKLGPDRDLLVENNSLQLTEEGMESIAQRLSIRLRFFYREWILDRSQGTKWFEKVLRKDVDLFLADQEIRQRVLNTREIRSIDDWSSSIDTSAREYSVTATVRTTTGEQFTIGFSDALTTPIS